jgi:S1-C subfamily serine protease
MNNYWKYGLALAAACLPPSHTFAADVDLTKPQPKVVNRTPLHISGPGSERTIDFSLWQSEVQIGELVGQAEHGLFCSSPSKMYYSKNLDGLLVSMLARNFKDLAAQQGFALSDRARSVFEDKKTGADFKLGATLLAFDYRVCNDAGTTMGSAYAKLRWELFSARRQKVVYSTVVEGSYQASAKIPGDEFSNKLMQTLAGNLLADPKIVELIQSGGRTDAEPEPSLPPLQIAAEKVVSGGVAQSSAALIKAVVTVESGVGSGSAFYVSRAGHLLTNHHVVADAKFVRIKLSDGRSMVGEVLRSDRARDVALVQTDPIEFDALALRTGMPEVGDEVFALGSPFGAALSSSVSRGVVSARRVLESVPFLQSDVAVKPGSSGGPLIDVKGRVVGITQLGAASGGLGLFIPIDEALEKLSLTVTPAP